MRKFLRRVLGSREGSIEKILNGDAPLRSKVEQALSHYLKRLEAERGCLLLEIPGSAPEIIHVGPKELEERFPFSRAVVDKVLDEGRGFYCYDSHHDFEAADSESLKSQGARSFVCTPLKIRETYCGAIYLDNPTSKGTFNQEGLADLERFAEILARKVAAV